MAVQRIGIKIAEQGRMPRAPPDWVPRQPNVDRIREGFNQRERDKVNGQSLGGRYGDRIDAQRASQRHQHQHQNKQGGTGRSYSSGQDLDTDGIFEQCGDFGSSRSGSRESDGLCDQLEEILTPSEDATESSVDRPSKSWRVKVKNCTENTTCYLLWKEKN